MFSHTSASTESNVIAMRIVPSGFSRAIMDSPSVRFFDAFERIRKTHLRSDMLLLFCF